MSLRPPHEIRALEIVHELQEQEYVISKKDI